MPANPAGAVPDFDVYAGAPIPQAMVELETTNYFIGSQPDLAIKKMIRKSPTTDFLNTKLGDLFGIPHPLQLDDGFLGDYMGAQSLRFGDYSYELKSDLVGVEVEVENVLYINPNLMLGFWIMDEDGSLRNRGREFKTHALKLKYIEPALKLLLEPGLGLNKDVDFSHRTSIHVHMDVRGMTASQLLGLVMTYITVENILFKYAGAQRRSSVYCVPIIETNLLANLDLGNWHNFSATITDYWRKYTALNLLPISKQGTIEFRQLPGTANVNQILIWIDLLYKLKLYAYQNPFERIIEQISELNTTSEYSKFIKQVFGDLSNYLVTTSLLADMERAVYRVKHCAAVNEFHQNILKLKTPETDSTLAEMLKNFQRLEQFLGTKELKLLEAVWLRSGRPEDRLDFAYHVVQNVGDYASAYSSNKDVINLLEKLMANLR